MTALFGPQGANAALEKPKGTTQQRYGGNQSWVKDCSGPGASDGTTLDAAFYNRIIGVLDYIVAASGVSVLPGDDSALYRAVTQIISGGAPDALNTLKELADALNDDPNFAATLINLTNKRIAYDGPQGLTATQMNQAAANMGLAAVARSGNYADLAGKPTLGSAAGLDVGVAANKVVQLDNAGKLPAVDGSQLTNVVGSGAVAFATTQALTIPQKAQAWANLGAIFGQCRLTKSGSNLLLSPCDGNLLTINGSVCAIPDAGVTLAPTGLTASTFYYIYATQTAGVITALEASTTVPVVQAGTGLKIKTGDPSRTLVGAACPDTGPAWVDTDGKRLVLSHFNRRAKKSRTMYAAGRTWSSDTVSEVSTEIRTQFISWSDEVTHVHLRAQPTSNTAAVQVSQSIAIDSPSSSYNSEDAIAPCTATAQFFTAVSFGEVTGLTENAIHYATMLGRAIGGAFIATWDSRTVLNVTIRG